MHQVFEEPGWRLSEQTVTMSSTQHLAGSEKQSKSVYRELYSAVISTRQATAASHRTPWVERNRAPAPSLSSSAGTAGGKPVGSQLWRSTRADSTTSWQPIAQGNLLLPSPGWWKRLGISLILNHRAAGVAQDKGCLQCCHLILLLDLSFLRNYLDHNFNQDFRKQGI